MGNAQTLHVLSTRAHANAFVRDVHGGDQSSTALFRTAACTTNELLTELQRVALPEVRVLGAFEERLLWKRVVESVAHPAFMALPNRTGIADALGAFAASCHRANLSGVTLGKATADLSPSVRERAEVLAQHLVAFERWLSDTRCVTKSMLPTVLSTALKGGAPLWPALTNLSQLIVPFLSEPSRATLGLFECLAKRLGYEVLVELPFEPAAAEWFRSVERNLRFLESTADSSSLTAITVSPVRNGPAQRAWGDGEESGVSTRLDKHTSPLAQYREVSRQIAELSAQGVPLDDIAVVSRSLERDSDPMRRELAQQGVAVRAGHISLTATPLVKWVLALLHASRVNYPRDTLAALIVSPYANGFVEGIPWNPTRLSRTLASAGARAREGKSVAPLCEALRRLDTHRDSHGSAVANLVDNLAGHGQALLLASSPIDFGRALEPLLSRLTEAASRGARERFERALEQQNLEADDWLMTSDTLAIEGMRQSFEKASRAWQDFSAAGGAFKDRFVECWIDALEESGDLPSRALWPGVSILSPRDVAGLQFPYVFMVGATDADYPKHSAADSLMSQTLERELNRVMEARQSKPPSLLDAAAPSAPRAEDEKYWFALAVCAASRELVIAWPASDADGRPTVCSPWAEDFLRRAGEVSETPRHGRTPSRTSWERDIQDVQQHATSQRACELRRRVDIELHRLHTVGDSQSPSDEYCGDLRECVTGAARALSASELETYASCHFRWLVERQFGVSAFESVSDQASGQALGKLGHAMLEAALRAAVDAGLTPFSARTIGEVLAIGKRAATETASEWMRTQTQDPLLGELEHARLWRQVARVLEALCWRREGFHPQWIEEAFGEKESWSTAVERDGQRVSLSGKVDLGLRCGSFFEVVDLKSRTRGALEAWLQPKHIGIDKLQLPLYAAVAANQLSPIENGPALVDSSYLSLREGTFTPSLREKMASGVNWKKVGVSPDEWLTFGKPGGAATQLENRVLELARGIEALDGRVLPTASACDYCALSGVCRIPAEHPPEEESEG